METGKKYSIKSRIIGIVMLCCFVPVFLTLGVISYYMFGSYFVNRAKAQIEQLAFDNRICAERLDSVVKLSRKATSDGVIEDAFAKYKEGTMERTVLLERSSTYLKELYGQNIRVQDAMLWFYEDQKNMRCENFNKGAGGSYQQVNNYWKQDHGKVYGHAKMLGTASSFYVSNGRLYLVRNLLGREYQPIGALVLRVNKEHCFYQLASGTSADVDVTVKLDDSAFLLKGDMMENDIVELNEGTQVAGYEWKDKNIHFFHRMEGNGYWMETILCMGKDTRFLTFYGYKFIIAGTLIFTLPLLWICIRTFKRSVTKPMKAMVEGAKAVEDGVWGYQITEQAESTEFYYLIETFNRMSQKIREQFIRIYEEEVAHKDAKIMALQSNINPHFLNNTLEIINWEARLAGQQKVSQMIESLSTLMDATIDRNRVTEVPLSEEMEYVNAYLYIASSRFGSRLEVINELPEELMEYEVPRLILQPVIENAVEHGAAKCSHGTVHISGYKRGKYLYIEIVNDAVLRREDKKKIQRLLDDEYDMDKEPMGHIGIANVNQRLRMLYGEPCGMTISMAGTGKVMARLTILAEKDNKTTDLHREEQHGEKAWSHTSGSDNDMDDGSV